MLNKEIWNIIINYLSIHDILKFQRSRIIDKFTLKIIDKLSNHKKISYFKNIFQDSPQVLDALGGIEGLLNFPIDWTFLNEGTRVMHQLNYELSGCDNDIVIFPMKNNCVIRIRIIYSYTDTTLCDTKNISKRSTKFMYVAKGGWLTLYNDEEPSQRFWYWVIDSKLFNRGLPKSIEPDNLKYFITNKLSELEVYKCNSSVLIRRFV